MSSSSRDGIVVVLEAWSPKCDMGESTHAEYLPDALSAAGSILQTFEQVLVKARSFVEQANDRVRLIVYSKR